MSDLYGIEQEILEKQLMVTSMVIPARLWNELIDSIPKSCRGVLSIDGEHRNRWMGIEVVPNVFVEDHIILYKGEQVVGVMELAI